MSPTDSRQDGDGGSCGHSSLTERTTKRIDVDPFDLGDEEGAIHRALELNRQLLYEPQRRTCFDSAAVHQKIDELLDRLLAVGAGAREEVES